MKFAGLLRGMLRRVDSSEETAPEMARPVVTAAPLPTLATLAAPPHAPATAAAVPAPPPPALARADHVAELEMPLMPILEKLPPDLRAKWTIGGVNLAEASICIAVEKVLPQLSQGVVKITFGELRNAAPNLFRMGEEYDSLPIALPLNDVLTRLNPALLPRHSGQRAVTPPPDITGPFAAGAQGVVFTSAPLKPTPPTTHFIRKTPPPSEPAKIPMAPPVTPPPPPFSQQRPAAPAAPISPIPVQPRANTSVTPPPPFSQRPAAPAAPISPIPVQPRANTPAPAAHTPVPVPQIPSPAKPPAPAPIPIPMPTQKPAPAPIPFIKPAVPTMAVPAAAPVHGEIATILAPLKALAEGWPETLRQEIVQLNLINAQVALPSHLIEPALRRGRVTFLWHQLRSWIRPTSPQDSSIHDKVELELPLKVIAPLFLPRQNGTVNQRAKAAIPPSSVPNLFFGFPQPQPEELAPPLNAPDIVPLVKPVDAKLAETNYYVWGDDNESPRVDEADYKRSGPATDFSTRRSMPDDIIDRAMQLQNVAGAIIALPDGLKVAHQLPSELNPDTVAAFLPQLFSRVSQCSKELRMGELNNLNFTIGNIPWKIFRVNAVYFAAFGRAGEPLPTAQLAALAGELDRKK
jgi:hypothetical protein